MHIQPRAYIIIIIPIRNYARLPSYAHVSKDATGSFLRSRLSRISPIAPSQARGIPKGTGGIARLQPQQLQKKLRRRCTYWLIERTGRENIWLEVKKSGLRATRSLTSSQVCPDITRSITILWNDHCFLFFLVERARALAISSKATPYHFQVWPFQGNCARGATGQLIKALMTYVSLAFISLILQRQEQIAASF